MADIGESETLLLCGDFNGHVEKHAAGYNVVHGGFGFEGGRGKGEGGVYQSSVANPLLFIIVWRPCHKSYAPAVPGRCCMQMTWTYHQSQDGLESRGLHVNMCKTKVIISRPNLGSLRDWQRSMLCVQKRSWQKFYLLLWLLPLGTQAVQHHPGKTDTRFPLNVADVLV